MLKLAEKVSRKGSYRLKNETWETAPPRPRLPAGRFARDPFSPYNIIAPIIIGMSVRKLHWETVSPLLRSALDELMAAPLLHPFRLVGGTALALQLGHRRTSAIDMYTSAAYGSADPAAVDDYLKKIFSYVSPHGPVGQGLSYFIGDSADECVKLDLFYTQLFLQPALEIEDVRLATLPDLAAMKMDAIQNGGRKKDFWDISGLLEKHTLPEMLALHKMRYAHHHDEQQLLAAFTNFAIADADFEPDCLRGKHWELIKLDCLDAAAVAVDNAHKTL